VQMNTTVLLKSPTDYPASFHQISSHEAVVKIGLFEIEVENSDEFLNLRSVRVGDSNWQKLVNGGTHGLLGQTWQRRRGTGITSVIQGIVDDYLIQENDVFGDTFPYNKFSLAA